MKLFTTAFTMLLFISCIPAKYNKTIKLNIMSTSDYCGGAKPSDDIIDELNTPKPFNGTIYIHTNPERRDKGVAKKIKNGEGTITLPIMGITDLVFFQYPAMNIKKLEKNGALAIKENECEIRRNFQRLDMINVDTETKEVSTNIHLTCDPCSEPKP